MIEIYDIRDLKNEERPLDITPQLAAAACNVVKEYCKKMKYCDECAIQDVCTTCMELSPDQWPEMEVPDA